ncbi:MAG: hypothetical protein KGJ45_11730 [Elusimicrobia bacterium]|nr:hypothetical protein [Elusimicrobiota bacterium]
MTKIAASLGLAALQIVESALRGGQTVNPNALNAVNAGLSSMITAGLEPSPAQAAAVHAAIGNLLVLAEDKAAEAVAPEVQKVEQAIAPVAAEIAPAAEPFIQQAEADLQQAAEPAPAP